MTPIIMEDAYSALMAYSHGKKPIVVMILYLMAMVIAVERIIYARRKLSRISYFLQNLEG